MKRRIISLCLIFTFLFTTCMGSQLEFFQVDSYALVEKKFKIKGKNKSVWKNHTEDEYLTYFKELGWRTYNPEYEFLKGYLVHKVRLNADLDFWMEELMTIRTCLYKDDVVFRKTLEETLSYIIPDGAKEIVDFTYKHHGKYNGKSYTFYNVNGTTVVIRDICGQTAITIFNKPYMKLKEMQKLGAFIK